MNDWHPGIGDPTFLGWFTVAAYAATALLCLRSYRLATVPVRPTRRDIMASRVRRRFWLFTAAILVAFGVNKQLDLQSFLLEVGRMLAKSGGWYESRRVVQYVFLTGVAVTGAAAVMAMLWIFRRGGAWISLAQFGLVALCTFVIVRAASFHHVDMMLGMTIGFFRLNHVLELGGIAVIAAAAIGAGSGAD
jgi:hypothetical protein